MGFERKGQNQPPDLFQTVWPENQLRYNGHYPWGDETVISYSVQGRPWKVRVGRMGKSPSSIIGSIRRVQLPRTDRPRRPTRNQGKTATTGHSIAWLQTKDEGFVFAPVRTASSFSKPLANNLFI